MSAPANRAEVVEVMARGVWRGLLDRPAPNDPAIGVAQAVLAALEAAGVRLVPVEATERELENCCAGTGLLIDEMREIRRTLIAASPYAPEGE